MSRSEQAMAAGCPPLARCKDVLRAAVLAVLLSGPTPGDIGSCGQPIEELDPAKFFAEKRRLDCEACTDCGFATQTCADACGAASEESTFPDGCYPLVHDGEVCLNALRIADCDDYARYVDDAAPEVPTECNFCPVGGVAEGG